MSERHKVVTKHAFAQRAQSTQSTARSMVSHGDTEATESTAEGHALRSWPERESSKRAPQDGTEAAEQTAVVLRGVSLITRGEHRGWGVWGDASLVARVVDLCNAQRAGLKCRFAHPGMSSDGIGTFLGRFYNARVVGDHAVADLHLAESARHSPQGDLVEYVVRLAEEDPEAFATSVVYERDETAFEAFALAHGAQWGVDPFGGKALDLEGFVSPDPDNTANLPHDFVAALHACDVVDEPAANPDGLFAPVSELGARMESVALVALGLAPAETCRVALGRGLTVRGVRAWARGFMQRHNLEIQVKGEEGTMGVKNTKRRAAGMDEDEEQKKKAAAAARAEGEEPEDEDEEEEDGEEMNLEAPEYKAGHAAGYAEGYEAGLVAGRAEADTPVVEEENRSRPATIKELKALTGADSDFVLQAYEEQMTELAAAKLLLARQANAPGGARVLPVAVRGVPAVKVDPGDKPTGLDATLEALRQEARGEGRKGADVEARAVNLLMQRHKGLYDQMVKRGS